MAVSSAVDKEGDDSGTDISASAALASTDVVTADNKGAFRSWRQQSAVAELTHYGQRNWKIWTIIPIWPPPTRLLILPHVHKRCAPCPPNFGDFRDYAHGYFSQFVGLACVLMDAMNVHTKSDMLITLRRSSATAERQRVSYTSFSARSMIVHSLSTASVLLYNRLRKVVATLAANKSCDVRGRWSFQTLSLEIWEVFMLLTQNLITLFMGDFVTEGTRLFVP